MTKSLSSPYHPPTCSSFLDKDIQYYSLLLSIQCVSPMILKWISRFDQCAREEVSFTSEGHSKPETRRISPSVPLRGRGAGVRSIRDAPRGAALERPHMSLSSLAWGPCAR